MICTFPPIWHWKPQFSTFSNLNSEKHQSDFWCVFSLKTPSDPTISSHFLNFVRFQRKCRLLVPPNLKLRETLFKNMEKFLKVIKKTSKIKLGMRISVTRYQMVKYLQWKISRSEFQKLYLILQWSDLMKREFTKWLTVHLYLTKNCFF